MARKRKSIRRERVRAATSHDLDTFRAQTTEQSLPLVALCWIETDHKGEESVRFTLHREAAPPCARTHLLGARARGVRAA